MEEIKEFKNQTFDEERALYGLKNVLIKNCEISGPQDGESALKECKNISVDSSLFDLRYPFWQDDNVIMESSQLTKNARAGFWYTKNVKINNCIFDGIKAFRECSQILIENSEINSPEFGWRIRDIEINKSKIISEYLFLNSENIKINNLDFKGKYSFQYCKNIEIHNSVLDTKDALWHSENVIIYDSVVKGEYLAWYSKNLKFIRCKIIGTQPLCYAENLILEDCTMEDCDLSFEYSNVNAKIIGYIESIKNPIAGKIVADDIGEVIFDENRRDKGDVVVKILNEI